MISEALAMPFFQRALVVGVLVSVACGVVGTFVVVKRISSISGGLSHAAFGGVGLGHFLGISPMLGAAGFCLAAAVGIGAVYRTRQEALDSLISMVWALGMAVGMLFIAFTPGYAGELTSYLFGSILFVPPEYLSIVVVLDVLVLFVVVAFFKELHAVAFDEEFSEIVGLPVGLLFTLLLCLSALVVVVLIRIAGVILTIALLTTPAVIARQWCHSLPRMMLLASVLTAFANTMGLFLAFWLSERWAVEAPTGPLIIVLVMVIYGVSSALRGICSARQMRLVGVDGV